MGGSTKRSTRLAAKKSNPKHTTTTTTDNNNPDGMIDNDDDHSSIHSNDNDDDDDDGGASESEYSGEEEEDGKESESSSSPIKTRKSTRRSRGNNNMGKQTTSSSLEKSSTNHDDDDDDSKTATKEGEKSKICNNNNNKPKPKTKSLLAYFTKKSSNNNNTIQPLPPAGEKIEQDEHDSSSNSNKDNQELKCGKRRLSLTRSEEEDENENENNNSTHLQKEEDTAAAAVGRSKKRTRIKKEEEEDEEENKNDSFPSLKDEEKDCKLLTLTSTSSSKKKEEDGDNIADVDSTQPSKHISTNDDCGELEIDGEKCEKKNDGESDDTKSEEEREQGEEKTKKKIIPTENTNTAIPPTKSPSDILKNGNTKGEEGNPCSGRDDETETDQIMNTGDDDASAEREEEGGETAANNTIDDKEAAAAASAASNNNGEQKSTVPPTSDALEKSEGNDQANSDGPSASLVTPSTQMVGGDVVKSQSNDVAEEDVGCSEPDLLDSMKDCSHSPAGLISAPGGEDESPSNHMADELGSRGVCELNNGSGASVDIPQGKLDPPVTTTKSGELHHRECTGQVEKGSDAAVQLVADLVISGENPTTTTATGSDSAVKIQKPGILEGGATTTTTSSSKERIRMVSDDPPSPHLNNKAQQTSSPNSQQKQQSGSSSSDSSSAVASTSSTSLTITLIEYPATTQQKQWNNSKASSPPSPSIGQLKMALYIEASKTHRCSGGNNGGGVERTFANYWETMERYITLGSQQQHHARIRSSFFVGIEDIIVKGFLKTRKLKRIHNKLVLAIMAGAMRTNIPSSCSTHIPQQWETKPVRRQTNDKLQKIGTEEMLVDDIDRDDNAQDRKSELQQLNTYFGRTADIWTASGGEANNALLRSGSVSNDQSIQPSVVGSTPLGEFEDEAILPSARLPGALVIEPMVRKHAVNAGLTASERAVWMLVVAAKEYSASLIKTAIANDKDFTDGCAPPQLPAHYQTSLACLQRQLLTSSENDKGDSSKVDNSAIKGDGGKKRVITSTSLSHILAENHSAASRLTSMYAGNTLNDGGNSTYVHLNSVNCIINSSIQRAVSRRYKSSTEAERQRKTDSPLKSPSKASSSKPAVPDGSLHNPRSDVISPPVPMPILNQPQLAVQRTAQPMPRHRPPPPQTVNLPQIVHESPTTSQSRARMQQLQKVQQQQAQQITMKHSDHNTNQQMKQPSTQQLSLLASNVEPLTKPGFPSLTNAESPRQKSPEPPASTVSSPPNKASSPPPRAVGKRGSKNLAALMARSKTSQTNKEDTTNAVEEKKENGSAPVDSGEGKGETNEKNDDTTKETTPKIVPQAGPARGKGLGFGAKNLAARRAKASAGGDPSADAGK